MATRTRIYKICDGCYRDEIRDGIEIVETAQKRLYPDSDDCNTIDICGDCYEADRYYCRLCKRVHDDEHPCDAQLAAIERTATDE